MINKYAKLLFLSMIFFGFATIANASQAVQCLVTVKKNPLWKNESVTVKILDNQTKKQIGIVQLPAATSNKPSVNMATANIDCYKYSTIQLEASYLPVVWSTEQGKTYLSKNTYNFYNELQKAEALNTTALEVTLTFPKDFIGVPSLVN